MFQADATIAWVDQNGKAQAQDYYLSGYVQVRICIQRIEYTRVLYACPLFTHSVVVAQGRVLIQTILPVAHHVAMMSLMCQVLYKRDNNVSPSQDLLILVCLHCPCTCTCIYIV